MAAVELIKVKDLVYRFRKYDENGNQQGNITALDGISVSMEQGSFVTILGHNGSGKSTLAKHLNALLVPTEGTVWIGGYDTRKEQDALSIRQQAGMVFQNPDNQIVSSVIEEDVAFGPENLGVPSADIERRVTACLEKVGMSAYRFHAPNKLSGGQKQRIAIAGVMAMKPKCMILDEATAMLDPEGRREVLEAVHALNREEQISIILITHHMEEAVDADRVLVMDGGRVVMDGTPREIFSKPEELRTHGLKLPDATELGFMLKEAGLPIAVPVLTEDELTEHLVGCMKKNLPIEARETSERLQTEKTASSSQEKTVETILELQDVGYTYGEDTPYMIHALEHISLRIEKGSFTGIVGHTGSGKSTLLQLLNGLLAPTAGHIYLTGQDLWPEQEASEKKKRPGKKKPRKKQHIPELNRRVGLVFQYPEYQLFEENVLKDVCFGPRNLGLSAGEAEKRAEAALKLVGIREEQFSQSPFVLSGGQMRRVALAGILAMEPEVLILDEPTAGLDPRGRFEILELLKRLNREQHMTILLVSHSMEDIAAYADHVLVLNDGRLEYDDRTEKVFSHRKELERMGLTVPAAARIVDTLRSHQIFCGQAFIIREAAGVISEAYRAGQDLQNSDAGQAVGQPAAEDGGATC
jgi:energy-coupling factor transport system ATP-binding protein